MDLTRLKDDMSVIEKMMMAPLDVERFILRASSGLSGNECGELNRGSR